MTLSKFSALGVGAAGIAVAGLAGAHLLRGIIRTAVEVEEAEARLAAVVGPELVDAARREAAELQVNAELFYGSGRVHPAYGARRLYEHAAAGRWPRADEGAPIGG